MRIGFESSSTMAEIILAEDELEKIYQFAIQLGKDAGAMLLHAAEARYGSADIEHVEKESAVDIVTKTDHGEFLV